MVSRLLKMAFYHEYIMPTGDENNFDVAIPPDVRDEFWRRVKFSSRHFFNQNEDLADQCRKAIEQAPTSEQLLVYYDAPLSVATDLADEIILPKHHEAYVRQFPDEFDPYFASARP